MTRFIRNASANCAIPPRRKMWHNWSSYRWRKRLAEFRPAWCWKVGSLRRPAIAAAPTCARRRGVARRNARRLSCAEKRSNLVPSGAIFLRTLNRFWTMPSPILANAIGKRFCCDFSGEGACARWGMVWGSRRMPQNIVFARTVEKLRSYFARQGISASSDALATFLGCAVRPAAPAAIQAAVHAAMNPSAVAASGHAAGLLSKRSGLGRRPRRGSSWLVQSRRPR